MKCPRPYIAVTGVTSGYDVRTLWRLDKSLPWQPRRLVGAILVSAKTLHGQRTESLRYPNIAEAQSLASLLAQSPVVPAIHYNTKAEGEELLRELVGLGNTVPAMRMLQLNVASPAVEALAEFRRLHPWVEVVLQFSGETRARYEAEGRPPWSVLGDYGRVVDHLLLDLSRGTGRPFPVEETAGDILDHGPLAESHGVRLGVAGGLGPDSRPTLGVLHGILPESAFAELSFDAESALRSPVPSADTSLKHQDHLDAEKVGAYLRTFEGLP